jgi:predicted glycoside hydrolase/deacetylase ChbG (UPF0249 family)
MTARTLIVNADDFGRSAGVNQGVIRAHKEGIVTSATLMVRWPHAAEAAEYARRSSLSLGLHVDLGEWHYQGGEWHSRYEVLADQTEQSVGEEVSRQLERFEQLAGGRPTHIDSHQHVHREEPVRSVLLQVGRRLGVPVRDLTPGITYSGVFYGQDGEGNSLPDAITPKALIGALESLPEGTTELACHPAAEEDHPSSYGRERLLELETLCDPRVAEALDRFEIALRSFADLQG